MKENAGNRLDQLMDLLADEVAERLRARGALYESGSIAGTTGSSFSERDAAIELTAPVDSPHRTEGQDRLLPPRAAPETGGGREEETGLEVRPADGMEAEEPGGSQPALSEERDYAAEPGGEGEGLASEGVPEVPPEPLLPLPAYSHTARLLGRLALGMLVLLVIINIPINRHGTTLATAMPDARALVFRDGLVVKEDDAPEIYVFQDGQFRWISSLAAFEGLGYTWPDVHVVEDGFLDDYPIGAPIHVLLKCHDSPHIFRLEAEDKRWIVDIDAFKAEGHVWEDVRFVTCQYLRSLPDGETIPPGHGPSPQP